MRIVFPSSAEYLTAATGNGEGLIAWELLNELAARGHEVVAYVRECDPQLPPAPFEIVEIPRSGPEFLDPFVHPRAVRRALGTRRFDVAHWLFPNAAPGFTGLGRLPLVVGPLVQPWAAKPRWWPAGHTAARLTAPLLRRRATRLGAGAAAVLAVDEQAARLLPGAPKERVHRLPFGVRMERFECSPLPARPTILFLGSIAASKGVLTLIGAMPEVLRQVPQARLLLAGTGPAAGEARAAAQRLDLGDTVRFLGAVPPDEVPALLAESSLLCLPSYGEPWGMVLLEAMASGRAVVSTRSGGPSSIVADGTGGALVEPGDAYALARALAAFLGDPVLLEEAGRVNRMRVEREFSLEAMVDRLEAVYRSVAGVRDSARPTAPSGVR
jgi:glycosyltransferase involved in cell wall biosynthesis